ncbi:DUF3533 domain-containing protein [Dietzia aurantiaca]|uniref:YhgE/Pip domain-containing protein n=1 Tax=Dietzia aurantiaca TaxID=983873 RepID=UPI001E5022E8|nr:DUF3533 domain-containing protein [Dietzia aurantiaca]MCD2261606.1 DUF3533 domain-containing protein [Dietzia aurantiaca]
MTDSGHTGGFREFASHSAGAIAVVCGLFFLLAFMYLGGTADPQAHARHVPVAVVNEDAGATLETPIGPRNLDVGTQITAGLLQNNDWEKLRLHIVDAAEAEEGLRDGSYFGAVRIPPELSRQVVDLVNAAATEAGETGESPERASVTLQYSPRVSIVSGQVMNTVAERMRASLHESMGATLLSDSTMLADADGRQIGAAAALALQYPVEVDVTEWNPLPDGVTNASLPMFYALIVILAGFTGAMIISNLLDARLGFIPLEIGPLALHVHVAPFGRLQTMFRKWAVTVVTAPLVSALCLWVADIIGVTGYDAWDMFWFSNLVIIAVGVCAHAILAAIGNAGLLVNLVLFVVLGIPTSGGATPTQMLPQIFVAIGSLQPMHQAYLGLRSIMFFDSNWGAGLGHAVWVLGGWCVAGVVLGVAVTLLYERMGLRRQAVADRVPAGRGVASGLPIRNGVSRTRSSGTGEAEARDSVGVGGGGAVGVSDPAPAGPGEPGQVVEGDAAHRQ